MSKYSYKPQFPAQYEANYDTALTLLELAATLPDIITAVMGLLGSTDFFEAPASTKYHGDYPGGLFDHSRAVADALSEWAEMGVSDTWRRPCSPVLVGLLHDFTKANKYRPVFDILVPADTEPPLTGYEYAPKKAGFGGHGEDSLCKVLLKVPLTEEEAMCIRWHMGPYEKDKWDDYDAAIRKFPNVLWTHTADMYASKVRNV